MSAHSDPTIGGTPAKYRDHAPLCALPRKSVPPVAAPASTMTTTARPTLGGATQAEQWGHHPSHVFESVSSMGM